MDSNYTPDLISHKSDTPSRSPSYKMINYFWKDPLLSVYFPLAPDSEDFMYTLDELCNIPTSVESRGELCLSNWLNKEIEEFHHSKYLVCVNKEVQAFKQLVEFGTSEKMIPDVSILLKTESTQLNLPVLLFEVVSGNDEYSTTLSHSVVSLIYQLRYLNHFCDKKSVCGFVFPKRRSKSLVTKIKLEWKELRFHLSFEFLKKDEIINSIRSVVTSQCEAVYNQPNSVSFFDFMRLDEADLDHLGKFTQSKLKQVNISAYSILTKDEKYYYKIVPYLKYILTLMHIERMKKISSHVNRLVLPIDLIFVNKVTLFQFEALPHQPLRLEQVKLCLTDFVRQAIDAILQLHEFGYAHTDIRFPNFCYSKDYELKLIDFDRAQLADEMYCCSNADSKDYFALDPPNRCSPFKCIDFKQLGLLILSVTSPELKEDNWSALRTKPANSAKLPDFIQNLIEGNYSSQLYDEWRQSLPLNYNSSIIDVLCKRQTE